MLERMGLRALAALSEAEELWAQREAEALAHPPCMRGLKKPTRAEWAPGSQGGAGVGKGEPPPMELPLLMVGRDRSSRTAAHLGWRDRGLSVRRKPSRDLERKPLEGLKLPRSEA